MEIPFRRRCSEIHHSTPLFLSHCSSKDNLKWDSLAMTVKPKKADSPSRVASVFNSSSARVGFQEPILHSCWIFTSLILYGPCAGKHSCCEVMRATVLSGPENTIPQLLPHPLRLTSFFFVLINSIRQGLAHLSQYSQRLKSSNCLGEE